MNRNNPNEGGVIRSAIGDAIEQSQSPVLPKEKTLLNDLLEAFPDVSAKPLSVDDLLDVPEPTPLIEYNGGCVVMKNGLNVLTGAPKAGKSTAQAWIISEACKKGLKTLIVDTEQGAFGLRTYLLRILAALEESERENAARLVQFVDATSFRGTGDKALATIARAAADFAPDLLLIDNYRHLLSDETDIANIQRTNAVLKCLCRTSSVLVTIHTNKTSNYTTMTGHAGSELEREADNVLQVTFDETSQTRTLKNLNQLTRYWQPVTFGTFNLQETEIVIRGRSERVAALRWLTEEEQSNVTKATAKRQNLVTKYDQFNGKPFTYKDIQDAFGWSYDTARQMIRKEKAAGVLEDAGSRGRFRVKGAKPAEEPTETTTQQALFQ